MADELNNLQGGNRVSLSRPDAEALDDLLAASKGRPVPGQLSQSPAAHSSPRHRLAARLLDLVACCPAEPPSANLNLAERTLARVEQARDAEHHAVLATLGPTGGSLDGAGAPFRWTEILAAAAAVVILFSLLWPALEFNRDEARRIACATHLSSAGAAMARYAQDHQGILPRGKTQPGASWWTVGREQADHDVVTSNSAHLYLLARAGYLHPDMMICPDNPGAVRGLSAQRTDWPGASAVSYSYQNQYTPEPLRLATMRNMPVLADKNPLFFIRDDRSVFNYRSHLPATSATPFHRSKGQNVLAAGGSVTWSTQPIVPGAPAGSPAAAAEGGEDNIWLIDGVKQYKGNEAPPADDVFLVP